jgi:hypothetical protein
MGKINGFLFKAVRRAQLHKAQKNLRSEAPDWDAIWREDYRRNERVDEEIGKAEGLRKVWEEFFDAESLAVKRKVAR